MPDRVRIGSPDVVDRFVTRLEDAANDWDAGEEVDVTALLHEAADQLGRLQAELRAAEQILGSEPMVWLIAGSGHPDSHLGLLRPAITAWWDRHGHTLQRGHR